LPVSFPVQIIYRIVSYRIKCNVAEMIRQLFDRSTLSRCQLTELTRSKISLWTRSVANTIWRRVVLKQIFGFTCLLYFSAYSSCRLV